MGVKGLGSFLKDNRGSLCRTIQLPASSPDNDADAEGDGREEGGVKVVVDAWSILFPLYLSSLPWQSGGEYLRYYRIVCRLIESWRRVGLEPIFVFDGASPPEKHSTLLHRLSEQLNTARLFYTTSPSSRSAPSFSRNQILLPPMTSHTMVHALHHMGVKSHYVPLGEADGFVVSLAESLGAYILSQDSDYLILISNAGLTRVKGYCPLDFVSWIEGESPPVANGATGGTEEGAMDNDTGARGDEWEVAHPRREGYTPRQSHLLPWPQLANPTLLLTFIPPSALRTRLRLPPSVMPLLASLCGNDYTPPHLPDTLFEASLKASARIEKVARLIRETLFGPSGSSSPRLPSSGAASSGDVAVELVRKLIKKLAIRDFTHDGALQELVEGVIEATFQYTLPLDHKCCDLFPFCGEMDGGCSTRPPSRASGGQDELTSPENMESRGKRAYAEAVAKGYGGSMAHAWAYPGRMYLWNVLEDPNGASLKGGDGARRMRAAAWGFAEEALGGLCWPPPPPPPDPIVPPHEATGLGAESNEMDGKTETSDEATLVDDTPTPPKADVPTEPSRIVVEYVRQSNRIMAVPNPLSLPAYRATPAALLPLYDRLEHYLVALQSNSPAIRALPPHLQSIVAILRFTTLESSRRSEASKWRRPEVVGVLRAALGTFAKWDAEWSSKSSVGATANSTVSYREHQTELYPLLTNRNANLVAALAATMTDSIYLAQSLLLHPDPISTEPLLSSPHTTKSKKARMTRLPHLIPFVWFSGATLHAILGGREMGETATWRWEEREQREFEMCWKALGEDMSEHVVAWDGPAISRPTGSAVGAGGGVSGAMRDGWRAPREIKRPAESVTPSSRRPMGASGVGGGGVKAMLERAREEDRKKSSSGRFDLLSSLDGA